jgi:hypothetical protein
MYVCNFDGKWEEIRESLADFYRDNGKQVKQVPDGWLEQQS